MEHHESLIDSIKSVNQTDAFNAKFTFETSLSANGLKDAIGTKDIPQQMKKAIKTINLKKLGLLLVKNKRNETSGIITDGDLKRIAQKYNNFENIIIKKVMKKNPVSVGEDTLAASALSIMNSKKITSLCVHKNKKIKKTIGIIHMHDILKSNIN